MAHELTDDALREWVAAGLSQREIARRTGLSRATLYKRFKRLGLGPVQRPVQSPDIGAVSSVGTGAVQAFDTGAVQRLDRLEDDVQGLRQLMQAVLDRLDRPPVSTPVQITTLPPWPKGEAVRWNLWLPKSVRDALTAWAAERDIPPSQLVTEILWKALSDRRASGP